MAKTRSLLARREEEACREHVDDEQRRQPWPGQARRRENLCSALQGQAGSTEIRPRFKDFRGVLFAGHDLWGVDAQGQAWRVFLSIPDDVPPPEGAQVTIQVGTSFGALWEGASGRVVVESGGRLLAAVVAGNSHFLPLLHPELRLEHGDQSCFEEEVESPCTYTGYLLQATAGAERRQLGYTERANLGPFAVIHAGLLSIGDLGACNAAPESYALAAVRR